MANLIDDKNLQDLLDKDTLELIGGENLPEEKKQELYQKMAETVQNRVIARIDDKLSEEERQEWMKLLDENDKTKMEEYLRSKDIDISKMLVEEAVIYKTEITSLFQKLKE